MKSAENAGHASWVDSGFQQNSGNRQMSSCSFQSRLEIPKVHTTHAAKHGAHIRAYGRIADKECVTAGLPNTRSVFTDVSQIGVDGTLTPVPEGDSSAPVATPATPSSSSPSATPSTPLATPSPTPAGLPPLSFHLLPLPSNSLLHYACHEHGSCHKFKPHMYLVFRTGRRVMTFKK